MSGVKNSKRCDSCRGEARVLSITMQIAYRSVRTHVPVAHICEGCILAAPDLAKLALELQGGEPKLAESLSPEGVRPRNRALFVLADSIKAVYLRWRGFEERAS